MQSFRIVWSTVVKPDCATMDFNMRLFRLKQDWNGNWNSTSCRITRKIRVCLNQTQNAAVLSIMKHAFTTIPGVLWIVTAVVLFFYRLNKKRYNEVIGGTKEWKKRLILALGELLIDFTEAGYGKRWNEAV